MQLVGYPGIQASQILMQEYEPGGVQVHLLDGVRTQNVGTLPGPGLCWPWTRLPLEGLHQRAPGSPAWPPIPHGRHPRPGRLVDGAQWTAG